MRRLTNMFKTRAELIVDDIIKDLSDRKGLDNEWSQIDLDIKEEIRKTWIEIVNEVLR